MSEAYSEYLNSEHWSGLRSKRIALSGHKCECCFGVRLLQVHHLQYPDDLYDCTVDDLITLCRPCHDILHEFARSKGLSISGRWDRENTIKLIRGQVHRNVKRPGAGNGVERSIARAYERCVASGFSRHSVKKFGRFLLSVSRNMAK